MRTLYLGLVMVIFSTTAWAQEPAAGVTDPVEIEIFFMAPGEVVKLKSGKLGRGYNLKEWMNLVRIDNALQSSQSQLYLIDDIKLQWTNVLGQKDDIIVTLEADKSILADRSLRLEGKWETCEEDLIGASSGPIWPYVVGIVGGAVGIAGASIAIGMAISR
jgi:hypothetical protein